MAPCSFPHENTFLQALFKNQNKEEKLCTSKNTDIGYGIRVSEFEKKTLNNFIYFYQNMNCAVVLKPHRKIKY